MSQMKWWTLLLLITIGLVSPACSSKNDPDDDEEETEELTGVITVNMRNKSQGDTSIEILTKSGTRVGYLQITDGNNFAVYNHYSNRSDYNSPFLQICDVGKKKMEEITKVPTNGWVTELAVEPKHAYVIRAEEPEYQEYGAYDYGYVSTGRITYYRLYVTQWTVNTSGGIIGAQVQYCEWKTTGK